MAGTLVSAILFFYVNCGYTADTMSLTDIFKENPEKAKEKEIRKVEDSIKEEQKRIARIVNEVGEITADCLIADRPFDPSIVEQQISDIKDAMRRIDEFNKIIGKTPGPYTLSKDASNSEFKGELSVKVYISGKY